MACSIDDCKQQAAKRGWCNAHYKRWLRTGDPLGSQRRTAEERFWRHVDKGGDECWLWTAALTPGGYGYFWNGERLVVAHRFAYERLVVAHRFAYERLVGPIPEELTIDHVRERGCVHKNCVNPAHLEPVTNRENQLRGDGLGGRNARKTHCVRGHAFDEANTLVSGGKRYCRTCSRDRARRRRAA